jgi:MATE family multidrug resistance protein
MNANDAQTVPAEETRWSGLREVSRMAWPIMLGNLSFVIMDFVDKYIVSTLDHGQPEPVHLAAIGSAGLWAYVLGIFFVGVAGCVSTFVSQSFGRGEFENCSRYAWQGIYISFATGIAILAMLPLARPFFEQMGHEPEVTDLEVTYFRIRILGFVMVASEVALASFFQAIGRATLPMTSTIAANAVNIVLAYTLVLGHFGLPKMGIAGAATATLLALTFQVLLLLSFFLSANVDAKYGSRRTWRFQAGKAAELFRIGWPAGLSSFLDVAAWGIFTSFIVGGFGAVQLAAHVGAINFMHLCFLPAMGLGMATTPIVGQWLGRGNYEMARKRAITAVKIGIAIMTSIGFVLAVFGPHLMRAFSDDPEVIKLGSALLILAAIFAGFDAVNIVLMGALRGAGDTRWVTVALFVGAWLVNLPLALLFAHAMKLGALGAWYGATIYVIVLSGAFAWRFHRGEWRHINIFSENTDSAKGTVPMAPQPETGGR